MSFPQRIKDSREAKELSQTELGRQLGVTRNAISLWEKGKSEPKASTLRKAAVILGVNYDWLATGRTGTAPIVEGLPLLGTLAAGVWEEVRDSQDDDHERVPVAPDPRYPAKAQYALKIRGNSVNKVAKDGTVVICVDILEAGIEIRENDLVWVERRQGNLVEATAKRIRKANGRLELWPESDDPRHQERVALKAPKGEAEVTVKGLIIGTYNPINRGD
jgi:transcriptional regulator with XRE-family HTH domain